MVAIIDAGEDGNGLQAFERTTASSLQLAAVDHGIVAVVAPRTNLLRSIVGDDDPLRPAAAKLRRRGKTNIFVGLLEGGEESV